MTKRQDKWEIVYIPDRPPVLPDQQPTVDVIASVIEPKLANTIVRRLNQIAPLEDLRHVKRVRKKCIEGGNMQLSVILGVAYHSQLDMVPSDLLELIKSYQLSVFITKVCKYVALSREEWEEQCKLWPTSYHPQTYNIDGITGFSEEDSQLISSFMRSAAGLAKFGDGQVVNAAIIVDPSANLVIASACDETSSSNGPKNKSGMRKSCFEQSIDFDHLVTNGVASHDITHSNGSSDELNHTHTNISCLYPRQWAIQKACQENSSNWHPLRHAAIVAIECSAARDRHIFPGPGHNVDSTNGVDQAHFSLADITAKQQRTTQENVHERLDQPNCSPSELTRPYLCTGYDIYLAWEPCIMCAMALVHQRIRRVFYAFPNPNAGALGTVHRLQGERSINHHYAVFRVLVPEDILDK